jgi:hypothetical protein
MTSDEALKAIQTAVARGRYAIHAHCKRRMVQRGFDLFDVKAAIRTATSIEPYVDAARGALPSGTSSWRVTGGDVEGDALTLGVDLFKDYLGHFALVVTAF